MPNKLHKHKKTKLERKPHEGRDDLVGEHKYGDAGQFVLLLVFITGIIIDLLFLRTYELIVVDLHIIFRIPIFCILFIIALYLLRSSTKIIFEEEREKPHVIKKGIYSRIRHPMYLGPMLIYLSFVILTLSILAAIIFIFAVILYVYIAGYEEKLLVEAFGTDYEEYMKETPMFIPRLR